MKVAPPRQSLFVYGTLMAEEVISTLLGRVPDHQPASLAGYRRHPVRGHVFPGMIPGQATDRTDGLLIDGLSEVEMESLDWFEDKEYTRRVLEVQIACGQRVPTQTYVWTNPVGELETDRPWSFQEFYSQKREWYLANTVRPCREQLDQKDAERMNKE